ncbi:MAG: tRNA (adenosine(37)-N6)-threonylcarbamoyltransferase complex ATPase subunit type 1 TsaE [Bacilli bacterium]|nr:tRNA (adenosine(37)-N6)-threonylcarbamoyltransferase complex ATPase subunit type 1 TsaE [Bacilli bacterium]
MDMVIIMDYKYTSRNVTDTLDIAQNIESEKFPNMVICLIGELGSGKTVFVKGFAQALGITENITSPTFNLVKEYLYGEMPLYHMDVYRLEGSRDNVGFDDYFNKNGVSIVEWSDLISDILPEERLEIEFKVVNEDTRLLVFKPYGKKYEDLCESVL